MLRRSRFRDVVTRQLDLFAADEADLLDEAEEADAAWTSADRDETEERFGDYQLVADAIGERLYDAREAYASTLEDGAADEYRHAFNAAALRRFHRFAGFLEEDA
jgi:sirohydrochlorin ferrochelatase